MEEQVVKIQRSAFLIKVFMALIVLMEVFHIYENNVVDWGALAGVFGVLSLIRGLLLSPQLLSSPLKNWFKHNTAFTKESFKYLLFGVILIVVSVC